MAPNDAPQSADAIVKAAGSNLALALAVLPREIRKDMQVFYAFCRVVDDIVDGTEAKKEEKQSALDRWRFLVGAHGKDPLAQPPRSGLEIEMRELCERRNLPRKTLVEIIDGVAMDLDRNRYRTFEELREYCYGVASAVGLVSVEIFGYEDPSCRAYAESLGYALQLTNILRDVGEDAEEGRIYLPGEDLERFEVTEEQILEGRSDDRFRRLMDFQAERAEGYFREALESLPGPDRGAMRSAETMRLIYHGLLTQMRDDGFRVLEKRYSLGKLQKLSCLLRGRFGWD